MNTNMNKPKWFGFRYWRLRQHYRDRNPPWIKSLTSRLTDYDFGNLPDATKAHLFNLELLASKLGNVLRLDAKWIERQISATEPVDFELLEPYIWVVEAKDESEASSLLAEREHAASTALAHCEPSACSEGEEEAEAEGEKELTRAISGPKGHRNPDRYTAEFEEWWSLYPKPVEKIAAFRAYKTATKRLGEDAHSILLAGVRNYVEWNKAKDSKYIPHPHRWLESGRWDDRPPISSGFPTGRDAFGVGG